MGTSNQTERGIKMKTLTVITDAKHFCLMTFPMMLRELGLYCVPLFGIETHRGAGPDNDKHHFVYVVSRERSALDNYIDLYLHGRRLDDDDDQGRERIGTNLRAMREEFGIEQVDIWTLGSYIFDHSLYRINGSSWVVRNITHRISNWPDTEIPLTWDSQGAVSVTAEVI